MSNSFEPVSPIKIIDVAEEAGKNKVLRHPVNTFFSAILAGFFIGVAFIFYITVTTGTGDVAFGLAKLVGGICFSLGLILVVVTGTDLFTSAILSVIALVKGKISFAQMIRNWIIVYIGNFVGSLILVALVWYAQEFGLDHGVWGTDLFATTTLKLSHSFGSAIFLGIMCNIMVCLAVWLNYAGRTLLEKMIVMILPVALFVASGFEHSIANMFLIPYGILVKNNAPESFWLSIHSSPDAWNILTVHNFLLHNLLPVTIGNIIGGLLVAFAFMLMHKKKTVTIVEQA